MEKGLADFSEDSLAGGNIFRFTHSGELLTAAAGDAC